MDASITSWRISIFRKLRRWLIFFSIANLILLIIITIMLLRFVSLNQDRAVYTIGMLSGFVEEMKNMNEKAVKVIQEASEQMRQNSEEIFRDTLAGTIIDNLAEDRVCGNYFDVLKIIECSQKYAQAPFTYQDLLTLAWKESDFDDKAVGSHGERGVWQILCWKIYLKKLGASNAFDIDVNCRMAMIELQEKYKEKGNFKDSIIAYNGWVVKGKSVVKTYYNDFSKKKEKMERWCKIAEQKSKKYKR